MQLYQRYATQNVREALAELRSSEQGITAVEALRRLAAAGANEVPEKNNTARRILYRQIFSAINALLAAAAAVALILREPADAITITVILFINTSLGFAQEYRSEHAVRALHTYLAARARVLRGGAVSVVPAREVVPGDLVVLESGDQAPADLRVVRSDHALVDESALTGESVPASKHAEAASEAPRDPQAAEQIIFSGTTVVGGTIAGVAFATARLAEIGRITELASAARRQSAFEQSVAGFSRFILVAVGATLIILFVAKLLIEGSTDRAGELLLFSLALAVSVVPEALPVVMTITFSRGARHLARRRVIVKRLTAIEDLGHIEILCADKTGTLTENKMRIAELDAADPEALLFAFGEALTPPAAGEEPENPFDRAVWLRLAPAFRETLRSRPVLGSVAFDHIRRRSSVIIARPGGAYLLVKGAPEEVLKFSTHHGGGALTEGKREAALKSFAAFGRRGYRALGLAGKPIHAQGPWTEVDESDLEWLGLAAFEDPLKPGARAALALAEQLKVRVKIISGDSPEVAGAVAYEVGIISSPEEVITGAALDALTPEKWNAAIFKYDVFARVTPEQKYRIIDELQHERAVGFLGEGINDAPALKRANVAIAVPSAADASKEAADVILLDRSLGVIIDGIREGRGIVANVAKYIRYTLAGNFGNFASIAAISMFIPFLPMLPVQILLTNLLTDFPLIALAMDRTDTAELDRPRRLSVRDLVFSALVLGLVSAVFDLLFFFIYRSDAPEALQTLWFTFSILAELATIFVIRTSLPMFRGRAPSLLLVSLVAAAAVAAVALPFMPFGQSTFHFVAPRFTDMGIVAALVAGVLAATEAVKLLMRSSLTKK